jgi:hypothetical protein
VVGVKMPFDKAGVSGTPTLRYAGAFIHKVADKITFPLLSSFTGREAPGKTGTAQYAALASEVELVVFSNSSAVVRFAIWNSTGTNPSVSSSYTVPDDLTTYKKLAISPRPVFAGVEYWVGMYPPNPVIQPNGNLGFGWGVVAGARTVRGDLTPAIQSTNFDNQRAAGEGTLGWGIYFDLLPTAPTFPATSVVGVAGNSITFTWGAVSSDGGQSVTGYRIQRSTDNTNFLTIVADTNSTSRTFTDSNLTPGFTYYYRVAAINAVAVAHGVDYSGPYSAVSSQTITATAGNAQSLLIVTVDDPEPVPVLFSDFGPGIRFTNIKVQYGSENLYNEVEASTQDPSSVLQVASAPGSKTLYGVRSYAITDLLNATDSGAFDVAKDYLTYYYQPELRVDSVTVDLSNLTLEERLQVLNLEIDSYISVSFTPNRVGDPKIASGLVTGISHRITITSHEVELRLRTERNLFTLDSDSKGILNVNILGP